MRKKLWMLVLGLAVVMAAAGCKKKKDGPAPSPTTTPAPSGSASASPSPSESASPAPSPALALDAAVAAGEEEEEETDGCPEKLSDKRVARSAAYLPLCVKALTRTMECSKDAKMIDVMVKEGTWGSASAKEIGKELTRLVGKAASVSKTCETLAHDLHCGYQGRLFADVPEEAALETLAAAADCAAVGAAMAKVDLTPTGE